MFYTLGVTVGRATIEEMVSIGTTNEAVVAALEQQGFHTSTRNLKRRLQNWGIRRTNRQAINGVVAEHVNKLFHFILLSDSEIAERIMTDFQL